MAVEVFAADEQDDQAVDTVRWVTLAEQVLDAEGVVSDTELSILFVDATVMADLNKRFLGKEGPTDVLAFPIDEEPSESGRHPDSGGTGPGDGAAPDDLPQLLGDVVICPAVAARNAPEHAGTYDDELALLLVHGILHLLGMDHEDEDEANAMEAREQALLARYHRPPPPGEPLPPLDPSRSGPRLPRRGDGVTAERLRRGDLDDLGFEDPPAGEEP